jgi:ABC-type cobalamin/Fe3+-siderophores transport system ATPase subunit
MLLQYKQNHKSINTPFKSIKLPDFTVLTGKNGSGKTHLLSGIKEGNF